MTFPNIPAFNSVNVEAVRCSSGYLINLPVTMGSFNPQTNSASFTINVDYPEGTLLRVGGISFTERTPPGCDFAVSCSGPPEPPTIVLDIQPNGFSNVDVCDDDPYNAAGFQPVDAGNPINHNSVLIQVCFNEQTQRWQYEFAGGHTVHFNIVIDICESNLSNLGINLIDD